MRRLAAVGIALALAASACGGLTDPGDDGTDVPVEPSVTEPATDGVTSPPEPASSPPGEEVSTPPPPTAEAGVLVLDLYDAGSRPGARFVWGDRVVEVEPFTFCWDDGGVGQCADGVPAWPGAFVEVPRGTAIEVSGIHEEAELHLVPPFETDEGVDYDRAVKVDLVDGRGTLDAEPGEYGLDVFAYFPNGDGAFMFRIVIVDGQVG